MKAFSEPASPAPFPSAPPPGPAGPKQATRWAFISDLHGNLVALERVLADLQHQAVDQLVCLGDVATLGPQPREVLSRLNLPKRHIPWMRTIS